MRLARAGLLITALAAAGCDGAPTTASGGDMEHRAAVRGHRTRGAHGIDREFRELAARIPGFAGWHYAEDGSIVVSLTPAAERASATAAIQAHVAARPGHPTAATNIVVREARYDAEQMLTWRQLADDALNIPGVVSTDYDERENRIAIGLSDLSSTTAVAALVTAHGIPEDAVELRHEEPPIPLAAQFDDPILPIFSGELYFRASSDTGCSIGFRAVRNGVGGWVGNSHCSAVEGGLDNSSYYLSLWPFKAVGSEAVDPAFSSAVPGCPAGKVCRFADAMFVAANSLEWRQRVGYSVNEGYLDASGYPVSGSRTLGGYRNITGYFTADPALGTVVRKSGWRSGTTRGTVFATCANYNVPGHATRMYLCQSGVDGPSRKGDSGGAVYIHGANGDAILAGILWAGGGTYYPASESSVKYFFSPMHGVLADLGALDLFP